MKPEYIILHWSAGTRSANSDCYNHYHGGVVVNNKGFAEFEKWNNYNQKLNHTGDYERKSGRAWNRMSVGLSICGMAGATAYDFGSYPLTKGQIEALCLAAAETAYILKIDSTKIITHAEAAMDSAYPYGPLSGDPETRWDLSILKPGKVTPEIARQTGDYLRTVIRAYKIDIMEGRRKVRELHYR